MESELFGGIFPEPKNFYKEYEETTVVHKRTNSDEIILNLVSHHSLWAHHLWNASLTMSSLLEGELQDKFKGVTNESILELGAGGGLPSIIASLLGCTVISTDYPDEVLIENLEKNVKKNVKEPQLSNIKVHGYKWGEDVLPLLRLLKEMKQKRKKKENENKKEIDEKEKEKEKEQENENENEKEQEQEQEQEQEIEKEKEEDLLNNKNKFDLILMSDLLFNHVCHEDLVKTCLKALRLDGKGKVLVTVTHHRPWLKEKDLKFFEIAKKSGFLVDKIGTEFRGIMFPKDLGDEQERSIVNIYEMTLEEHLDVVNQEGIKQGQIVPRSVAHLKGIWHSVLHIWIYDYTKNQVLLQKRSVKKKVYPGLYDLSCGGHISSGDDILVSCKRELYEELGLLIKKSQLIPIFQMPMITKYENGLIDREIKIVYLLNWEQIKNKTIKFIDGEVEEMKWFKLEDLKQKFKESDPKFTPADPEYLEKLLNSIENFEKFLEK
ncbi:protein n-terminal and lysine n-methyltransferase efm7 [Anaeramoeba flamelloides]|uniref:Protein n-terminal and lysine n-methyltransferase efm7 n=1 Tax=Anaeramoeba flamelloides TaxID=1746091 RepID=A0ABQ8Z400_9EUKA|nr:protein n-terminal and lysine n-methyltransferase efm7 [Anaeramoeba flamelloides]